MSAKKIFVAVNCLALLLPAGGGGGAWAWSAVDVGARVVAASARGPAETPQRRRRTTGRRAKKPMSRQRAGAGNVAEGTWGGAHMRLQARADGADVEFDCGHGRITVPLETDAAGNFDWPGSFVREGGPVRLDSAPAASPARYRGHIEGRTMTLRLTLTGAAQTADTYTLTHGSEGRLRKCL